MTTQGRASAERESLRLKAILDSAVAGIITIDSRGFIETVSQSA